MTSLLQAIVRVADSRTSDADLLARFAANRDERAFEEVVRRHGPLVWSVCRHLLPHHADAEDAFQAVFFALVRSAGSIRDGRALPAWLHGVAVRVAEKAKRTAVRRRQREQRVATPESDRPVPDASWAALMTAVHEEIRTLPEVERTAFVLCDLEGVRQPDAAARLGWPLGTLSGRLCKARQRLIEALSRRGIAPGVLAVGGVAGSAGTVPAMLITQVMSFPAAGVAGVSSTVAMLARGLVEGTTMRTKLIAATLLVVGALGISGSAMLLSTADAQSSSVVHEVRELVDQAGGSGGAQGGGGAASPGQRGGGGAAGGGDARGGGRNVEEVERTLTGSPNWEYKFVDIRNDRKDFERTIAQNGKEGWEYAGSERDLVGQNRGDLVLVFKKSKASTRITGGMMGPGGGLGGGGMGMPGMGTGGIPGLGGLMGGGGGSNVELEARTFRPKNTSAADVAAAVQKSPAFKNRNFKVIAERNTNMVIVLADPAEMKNLAKMIEDIDAKPPTGAGGGTGGPGTGSGPGPVGPGGPGRGPVGAPPGAGGGDGGFGRFGPVGGGGPQKNVAIRIYALKSAAAADLVVVIGKLFPNIDITSDTRSNQIIVRADSNTENEIEALIRKLDVDVPKR